MKKRTWGYFRLSPWTSERYLYFLACIVFVTGMALLVWFLYISNGGARKEESARDDKTHAGEAPCDFHRILDGVCVERESDTNPKLVAVMIENHVDARPQAGLAEASVVYEAPVEANITRFLALFPADRDTQKIGPVRSARPYYLDWVSEYGTPLYMHVGGSPDALSHIQSYNLFDMNEMSHGWYFWRSEDRTAPHNTYTSSKLWQKALTDYAQQYDRQEYEGWMYGPMSRTDSATTTHGLQTDARSAEQIVVSFASPAYEAVWTYSSSTGTYIRSQSGRAHTDEDGAPIAADTVIVQQAQIRVLDDVGRREIDTIGSGPVRIFRDGIEVDGVWKKDSRTARTKWLDATGNDIPLAPGHIWIEVVGREHRVQVWPTPL